MKKKILLKYCFNVKIQKKTKKTNLKMNSKKLFKKKKKNFLVLCKKEFIKTRNTKRFFFRKCVRWISFSISEFVFFYHFSLVSDYLNLSYGSMANRD